jgi:DNA-binding transcriptional LysR family regulator
MLKHLRAGRLDYLWTTVRPDIPREFRSEKLFASELCIVCGPEHPLCGMYKKAPAVSRRGSLSGR